MSNDETNPFQSPQTQQPMASYGASPAQGRTLVYPFESAHTRAVFAMTMLALVMAAFLVQAGSTYLQLGLLTRVGAVPAPSGAQELLSNYTRQRVLGIGGLILYLASGITFLIWLHRSQRNLPALGNQQPEFSPAWAVGGWFIPFYNLVQPLLVASALWKGSDPVNLGAFRPKGGRTPALVGLWWGLFLAMIVTRYVGNRILHSTFSGLGTVDGLTAGSWVFIVGCLLALPAGAMAILLVYGVDRNQQRRYELVEQQAAAVPGPAPAPVAAAALPQDDFPFVPPPPEEPWTPPEDAGEYPRFK
jgi:hypothetical protein